MDLLCTTQTHDLLITSLLVTSRLTRTFFFCFVSNGFRYPYWSPTKFEFASRGPYERGLNPKPVD